MRSAPVYEAVELLLESSPLPWTGEMIREWFGWSRAKENRYLSEMAAKGRIARPKRGMFTAKDRIPLKPPSAFPLRGVTFSSRGPGDVITDDMLARYGFNL